MSKFTRFTPSIRIKTLLLLPLVLAIPYVGYQHLREVESFLRGGLEETLFASARALASALHDQPNLFQHVGRVDSSTKGIYAHPLPASIEVDGYIKDWSYHMSALETVSSLDLNTQALYVAGKHGDYLYLVVQVIDDDIVYRDPRLALPRNSDRLRFVLKSPNDETLAYMLSPTSPGRVSAYEIVPGNHVSSTKIELRILAAVQPTRTGFALEIRIH